MGNNEVKKEEIKERKNNNSIIWIIIAISILFLSAIGYIVYDKIFSDKIDENGLKSSALINEDVSKYTNELKVRFLYYEDPYDESYEGEIYVKTETNNAREVETYKDVYVFYLDNQKYKLYDNKNDKYYVINIPTNYYRYSFEVDEITDELVGIVYEETSDSKPSFYSFDLNKVLYDKKYESLEVLSKKYIRAGGDNDCYQYDDCSQADAYLLSVEEEKILHHTKYSKEDIEAVGYQLEYGLIRNENNDTYIFFAEWEPEGYNYRTIYTENFKPLANNIDESDGFVYCNLGTDGYLYVAENGTVRALDSNGNVIKKSVKKYDIESLIGEYILAIKNNKLLLATLDGKEIILAPWKEGKNYVYSYDGPKFVIHNEKKLYMFL